MRTVNPEDLPTEVLETSFRLGKLVAATRKSRGMTQDELCAIAGIGRTTLLEIEHGSPRVQFVHWLSTLHALHLLDNFSNTISAADMGRIAKSVKQPRKA